MTAPRTIDNLGPKASEDYALSEQFIKEYKYLIDEASTIPVQAEIQVTTSFLPAETQSYFSLQPSQMVWAHFTPPAGYFSQKKRLFTFQLLPFMGSEDKKEAQLQKILTKIATTHKKSETTPKDKQEQYAMQKSLEKQERDKQILTALFKKIGELDKLSTIIIAEKNRYQKG